MAITGHFMAAHIQQVVALFGVAKLGQTKNQVNLTEIAF
jgi:hypothetical protein